MEIIRAVGRVTHVSEFDYLTNRVGVFYDKKRLDRTISGKIRTPRQGPKIPIKVSIRRFDSTEQTTGRLIDFTATTARIKFESESVMDITINTRIEIAIHTDLEPLFTGQAAVIRKKDDDTEIIVRFVNAYLDMSHIETVSTATIDREVIKKSVESVKEISDLSNEYKALICDWRMYVDRLKRTLDQEESKRFFTSHREKELFVKGIEDGICTDLDSYVKILNKLVAGLGKKESLPYKKYYRENLNPYFKQAPLMSSIIEKNSGYSGDYETIKQFFDDQYAGDTLFAKMINRYVCRFDAVTAHQDRIRFLTDQIQLSFDSLDESFTLLSLGSGPAEEILRFVRGNTFPRPVMAHLLDMDAYALADVSERLQYIPKKNFTINLENVDIMSILRDEKKDPFPEPFHFSYCAGLFDYFQDSICKRLIKFLVNHTRPGGTVVVTNVHTNNRGRFVMDYCGGWEIIHRTEAGMAALVEGDMKQEWYSDKSHTNIYLKLTVPEK